MPTASPKTRLLISLLFAVSGAIVMLCIILQDNNMFREDEFGLLIFAFAGAMMSGYLVAPLVGLESGRPWLKSGIAALTATTLGASLGAFIAFTFLENDLVDTFSALLIGPVFVGSLLFQTWCGPIWLACMASTHFLARLIRRNEQTETSTPTL